MKKVLLVWPLDTDSHHVWRGYYDFLDENFDLTIVFFGGNYRKTNVKLKNGKVIQTSWNKFRFINNLRKIIRKEKPDVFVCYHIFEPSTWQLMLQGTLMGIPTIILEAMHIHPLEWKKDSKSLLPLGFRVIAFFTAVFYNLVSGFMKTKTLCMTKRSLKYMKSLGFSRNISYSFIPYSFFSKSRKTVSKSKKLNCIYVGRLTEMKNMVFVLNSLRNLKDRGIINSKNFEFKVVGGVGESRDEFVRTINKNGLLDLVTMIGTVEHSKLDKYYSSSDLFILPSYDVLGAVTLEAIENNLPVLIADKSGFSGIMKKFKNRLIFKQNDSVDFENKLIWCLRNKSKLNSIGIELNKHMIEEEDKGRKKLKFLIGISK